MDSIGYGLFWCGAFYFLGKLVDAGIALFHLSTQRKEVAIGHGKMASIEAKVDELIKWKNGDE